MPKPEGKLSAANAKLFNEQQIRNNPGSYLYDGQVERLPSNDKTPNWLSYAEINELMNAARRGKLPAKRVTKKMVLAATAVTGERENLMREALIAALEAE